MNDVTGSASSSGRTARGDIPAAVENTHTMLVRRPDGVTWCILVSGDVPESTESLREVFDAAFGESGVGATLI